MGTYSLQRFDDRKLLEALSALKTARQNGEAGPLYPWLESWRAQACAEGDAGPDDFRALYLNCVVGKPIDLLDRTPAVLAGRQADQDLRSALLGLELGGGLERWMREEPEEDAPDALLGLLRSADVVRLSPRVQAIAPGAIAVDPDELETYAPAWEGVRRAFATAASRNEALALVVRAV